jgi:MFS family permease
MIPPMQTSTVTRLAGTAKVVREVLANPAIRRTQVAWTAGVAGDAAFVIALLIVAFDAGGPLAVGILGVLRMAPSVVAAPLAHIPAARVPPGRLLLWVQAIRAAAAVAATVALAAGAPLAAIFVFATVAATAGALVRPLQSAVMPSLARTPGELVAANVATSVGEGLGAFAGPLAAGIVAASVGTAAAAAVGAILLCAAAVTMLNLAVSADDLAEQEAQRRSLAVPRPDAGRGRRLAHGLAAGPAALRLAPGAATIVLDVGAQVVVRGLMTTLIVVASIELLGLGNGGVGLLTAAFGLGSLGGALAALSLAGRRRLGPVFSVALALWGLPLAVIGAVPVPAVAIVALLVSGVANATLDIAGYTLLQRSVPTAGRVSAFGLLEAVVGLGVALGGLAAPILIGAFGERGALAIAGALLPLAAVATWPRIQQVDDEAVVPERELALLRGIPLFARLPMSALERVAGGLEPVAFAPGEVAIREGEPGDRYLIIAAGELEVTRSGRLVNRCGPGEGIGEIALLHSVPRSATVTAVTPTEGFALSSADFLAAVAGPTSAAAAQRVAEERLARSSA